MAERDTHETARSAPPPRVRRGPARPIFLVVSAMALCALLIWVVMNIDTHRGQQTRAMPDEVIELIAPRGLSESDRNRSSDMQQNSIQPELSKGGTIEIADPQTQQLVQRYRFASLDPNPAGEAPGWLRMNQPRFEVFLDDNRVVTIDGDSALAYRPHREIESGTITGNVVVRLYEGETSREVDLSTDQPSWVVTTHEASMDNFLGEIRCDDWVLIESDMMTLPGRRLRVLVDDQSDRIELRIAEPQYIRLVSNESVTAARSDAPPTSRQASSSRPLPVRSNTQGSPFTLATHSTIAPAPSSAQFYLLTIEDDVIIKQGEPAARRTARGDVLEMVFSTETRDVGSAIAAAMPPQGPRGAVVYGPVPLHSMLAAMAITGFEDEHRDEDERLLGPNITLIRCSGELTIVPLDDSTRQLDSPADARLELTGSPAVLHDVANESEARGRVLAYQSETELIELIGSTEHPLLVKSPEMDAGGERFFHNASASTGGFTGAGWMTHRQLDDDDLESEIDNEAPTQRTELHITWQQGMDLQFGDTSSGQRGGRLKSAHFQGDVKVITDEFNMDAEQMTVGFTDDASTDAAEAMQAGNIEFIHAVGAVRVTGVANTSSIKCEDLHLDLAQTANGKTIPKLMIATGGVEAIDETQMIWCDALRVSFIEAEDDEAQVDELLAERDVQVLLEDGTRAFGDRLIGDGVSETVELLGDDVTVISDKMVMDRGKRLILDRSAGSASSPGPGSLRIFSQPVLPEERNRIERPTIEATNSTELSAAWTESMFYDSKAAEGAGSVDFRGNVDVLARPTPLEQNTMTGDALTLVFHHTKEQSATETTETAIEGTRTQRDVRTLIARQDAKIESHTYATPDHEGEPSVFYIAGDYVEYDTHSAEALVAGAGELLIHDVTPPEQGAVSASTPFGSKGTSMMQWQRELRMTRAVDDVFNIVARGEVVLRHQDLEGTLSWLTGEKLEATIKRRDGEQPSTTGSALDMGGSADLQRVKGSGGVVIRTDRRTVNCDEFDYDVNSGIARLIADPGRVVSIETQGSRSAVTASEAIWDMDRDSIRIIRAAGASGN